MGPLCSPVSVAIVAYRFWFVERPFPHDVSTCCNRRRSCRQHWRTPMTPILCARAVAASAAAGGSVAASVAAAAGTVADSVGGRERRMWLEHSHRRGRRRRRRRLT